VRWLTYVITATQEAEIERITVKASWGRKFMRPHFNQSKLGVTLWGCHLSYTESINKEDHSPAKA
jgi:hypothetical protein